MAAKDGMFYAAKGKPDPVVKPGEFVFSAVGLDHGHIYGMTSGLLDAGATLKYVYDPDPQKVEAYRKAYPQAIAAESEEQVLADPETKLVAGACVTSERAALGIRVMQAGKDYFTDKAPLTTLEQLEDVKRTIAETGRKYMVNYSERLQVEAAVYAGELVQAGAIGKVVQVIGMGPHRLNAPSRPAWFFEKEKYGGILCDIGSHQIEQFLFYTGAKDAKVVHSKIANYNHPDTPELDDFGDATLVADNGATGYFRVDWFTPDGLSTWGRRPHLHLGHRWLHRAAQVRGPGPQHGGEPRLLGGQGGRALLQRHGQDGLPLLRPAGAGLHPPHGKRHDPGAHPQGGGTVRARPAPGRGPVPPG